MSDLANQRRLRGIVRAANRQKRLRAELRKLDGKMLLKRLAKYVGRTPSEVHSNAAYGGPSTWQGREALIDRIVYIEEPGA